MSLAAIVSSWIYTIVWLIPVYMSPHKFVLDGYLTTCKVDYLSRDKYSRDLLILLIIGPGLIPMFIIMTFQALTFVEIKKQKKRINLRIRFRATGQEPPLNSVFGENLNIILLKETKLAKKNILFVVCYSLTYLPHGLYVLIAQYSTNRQLVVNPLMAGIMNFSINLATITFPIIALSTENEFKRFTTRFNEFNSE